MARRKFLTAPVPSTRMPPGIPYIVGNEAAERFSSYGMRAVLVVFMTRYLMDAHGALAVMKENEADKWYHVFVGSNYFFPTLGAILCDAYWGKYRTILWLSLVYCAGHAALAMNDTRAGLAVGLGLIAIGAGGIKPCVSANVGDQFGQTNAHLVPRAFAWFYVSINVGSTVSFLLIPWLLETYGSHLAFAVPGILMLFATIIFWLGRHKFVHIPPRRDEFIRQTLSLESLRIIGRLAIIFAFVIVFWALWDQSGSEWVLQAEKMDLRVSLGFVHFTVLPSQMGSVNAVMIVLFVPLFQYLIYPLIDRVFPLTALRKIGLGLLVIAASFVISAWIEWRLASGAHLNVAWQLPAYALLSGAEILTSITSLEFAYTQAPTTMKSVVMSLYLLSVALGNFFTAFVHWLIAKPDGSAKLSGPSYYLFFAGLAVAAGIVFAFVAARYREHTILQREQPAAV